MDGYTLLYELREALNESSTGSWLNNHLGFTFLYEAACEINARHAFLTGSQTVTTVASTSEYHLDPAFMGLYMRDPDGNYFTKYYDTSNYTFINHESYERIYYDNQTTDVSIPDRFSIKPQTTAVSNVTGTASAIGTVSSTTGEATLTDTSSATKFANVEAGDLVHNTTTDYHGIVIAVTSDTALVTAIFNSTGTAQSWASSDAYVIVPQGRFSLILDPPSLTAGHSVYVPYIKKPTPVYGYYRSYPFPVECKRDLISYAAARYKLRDRDEQSASTHLKMYERNLGITGGITKASMNRGGFKVNFKKGQR